MTILGIVALCIFVFGAYAYGSVVMLALRHGGVVWSQEAGAVTPRSRVPRHSLAMFAVCTVWFVLHSVIGFRSLMGEPGNDDLVDLATLELVFLFPGLIFHTVLGETQDGRHEPSTTPRLWLVVLAGLYLAGVGLAVYFTGVIFDVLPGPARLSGYLNLSIGTLFSVSSVFSIAVMTSRPRKASTVDQRRMRRTIIGLFVAMIVVFVVLTFMRDQQVLVGILEVAVRATPLAFLLVAVYFENRIEFYDLIVKRGVLLLLSLLILASVLALTLPLSDSMPGGITRAWLFAVVLVPIAMAMPSIHGHVGRLLDRLWFGREFTPVEAIKHVLGAMQQATDESSLIRATEATLSEMFRRRVLIVLEGQDAPAASVTTAIHLPGSQLPIHLAIPHEPGVRPLLSEDHAMLRSLGSVFGFMLENVRLQQKRQEQEQLAQELRLQTSRSELKALRAQINPHFLFNALNAIASLIHTDPARADAAVEQLAEVFRYTLRRSEQEWAPLDQELAFARAYLDVEQARFGRRLAFSIHADPDLVRAQVPAMLLQTLVENAVKHGISRLRTPGRIDVRAARANGRVLIEVRDTGPALDAATTQSPGGESFGLRSVRERLQGHFGAEASLALMREDQTTVARLELPLIEQPSSMGGTAR